MSNLPVLWAWIDAKFRKNDEAGANLVEYVLLLAFIALAVIVIVGILGGTINDIFTDANTELGG